MRKISKRTFISLLGVGLVTVTIALIIKPLFIKFKRFIYSFSEFVAPTFKITWQSEVGKSV